MASAESYFIVGNVLVAVTDRTVVDDVAAWDGVETGHRNGTTAVRLDGSEFARLHPERVEVAFPRAIREAVIADGRAEPHPNGGWVRRSLESRMDERKALWLLRLAYLYRVVVTGAQVRAHVAAELSELGVTWPVVEAFNEARAVPA